MRKKILVTGGAGFLGSHLCEQLLNHGYDVICVDNLFTGSKENIIHLMDSPYFDFIRHDITHPLFIEVDEIYNLAAQSHVAVSFEQPEYTADSDAIGTLRYLATVVTRSVLPTPVGPSMITLLLSSSTSSTIGLRIFL